MGGGSEVERIVTGYGARHGIHKPLDAISCFPLKQKTKNLLAQCRPGCSHGPMPSIPVGPLVIIVENCRRRDVRWVTHQVT